MMAMKPLLAPLSSAWCLVLNLLCGSAFAQPHWTSECPNRIEEPSQCHLLPSEGLMALRVPVAEDKGGLWGFVNAQGRMVIAPVYDSVLPFSQGLAAARKSYKWGVIDQRGHWRIQPVYDDITTFDEQGIAWAVRQGDLLRLSSKGEALQVLPQEGEFELDHPSTLEQSGTQVRVMPAPESWHINTGEVIRWPVAIKEIGRVSNDAWPLRVKLPSGQHWWGVWSLKEGRWLASPLELRSELEPIFHGNQVAVLHEGQWRFVDWQGRPISEARYLEVQMDQPGLWVVSPGQSIWEWLGPDLVPVHRIEQRVNSPSHQRWGEAMVYDLGETLLLCYPGGRILRLDVTHHTEHLLDGWIWLSPDDETALPDLIGPEGHSVLTDVERLELKRLRLEVLWDSQHLIRSTASQTSTLTSGPIRAILHPTDASAHPGVITADLKVIRQADWILVMPGNMPSDPVVVQRTDGRFGTIDGQGRPVIPAEWLSLDRFHNGLTWGRHPMHEGGVSPVLIGADGARLPLPPTMYKSCSGWVGQRLYCTETSAGASGVMLIDPLTQHEIQAPSIDQSQLTRGGLLLARHGTQWGLMDDKGTWRMPPLAEAPDAIEWLDNEIVRVVAHIEGRQTHQLWNTATARPLTDQPRTANSWRIAPNRYVVAGEKFGMEALDATGRVVFKSPWWGSPPQTHDSTAWVTQGQQLARVHSDGTLTPSPIHANNESARSAPTEASPEAQSAHSWKLRLKSHCGQLIVFGPSGHQTWPPKPVSCRKP